MILNNWAPTWMRFLGLPILQVTSTWLEVEFAILVWEDAAARRCLTSQMLNLEHKSEQKCCKEIHTYLILEIQTSFVLIVKIYSMK